ncbi:2-amino-4-hydroxy-6-hydroxymethyldihydropteridine diphosphokinase [Winogradskyella maritima]|uniref:2-amino-4-hydroxy-6-hydroxymethyldihydropteridine pyrophosphokinase n=1 Tax=Winogradskyella maritima TaxID=1517766 RepID=A0ABV8ACV2_9FLAO|nr:2-amino-4-hydroxy-6-hydroxymethyldihydropteridine diphosphokinase [Winogradskyella maritima]
MTPTNTAYIALGSNKGNRFDYLQSAVDAIFRQVGSIKKISKIYQTPAVGFDDDNIPDFYNACVRVTTDLKPKSLMKLLLNIEKDLGRERKKGSGYASRIIDLDLLFYNDEIIESKSLQLPHPELHNRRFVLQPLCDVGKDTVHPRFEKTVDVLLSEVEDQSHIEPLHQWLKNPSQAFDFGGFNYLAIEGNIGAGKTSLANKIAQDFNAKLILERFADNAFLPKFYKEPERYAFTLEMSFLADRYQQISDDLSQLDLFKDFMVSDYDVNKSLIFSKVTLPEDEFRLYRKLFYQVYKDIAKPDLYVYLYQNTERLQANIKKRGRAYEKNIEDTYLEKLNAGYLEFLKSQTDLNVKIIDISDRDFVKNREDYLWLLRKVIN